MALLGSSVMRCCGDPSDCSRPCEEERGPEPTFRVIDELHVWSEEETTERFERLRGTLNERIHIGVDVAAPGSFTFWTDAGEIL